MRKIVFLLLLMSLVIPACGQTQQSNPTNLKDLLSNQNLQFTVQLKDLNADWTRLNLGGGDAGMGGYMQMISSMFGGSSNHYFTKGQTVAFAGETFLVAYAFKSKPIDPSAMMGGKPPVQEKKTQDSPLTISLINLRTCGNLSDIRPFDLNEELAESTAPSVFEEAISEAKDKSIEATSLSNLKQMGLSLLMYMQDYDEVLPPMGDAAKVKKVLYPYVKDDKIFINPITNKPYVPNAVLSLHREAQIESPSQMVVFYEDAPAPDGTRGVAFLDGHAKRIPESEWPKLKKASKIP